MIFTLGVASTAAKTSIGTGAIVGMVAVIALIIGLGFYAGSQVKSAADFSGSSRTARYPLVAGTIMGTLVGGASTVGTAQLAFEFGMCAWWFTLGAGIGCLILGLTMIKPLYTSNKETIPQYLVETYGDNIGPVTSVFSSIGIFLNIIAQGLAAVALLTATFHMNAALALIVAIVMVFAYVFGGVKGTGIVGVTKMTILYISTIITGVLAFSMFHGMGGIHAAFPNGFPWFSLLGRGASKDLAAGGSLLLGVLSTQTYIQAVTSAKTLGDGRKGALISALLIPPIGIGGILVGLFMKAHAASFPGIQSGQALPTFVMHYLPGWLSGIIIGALLIAVIGTFAGLCLGVSTMLTNDIYKRYINKTADSKKILLIQRGLIVVVCLLVAYFCTSSAGALILGFSFLSMGLRGCAILLPLLGAIYWKNFVTPAAGIAAAILGPLTDFYWAMAYPKGLDALYPGIVVAGIVLVVVSLVTKKKDVTVSIPS
ncbi:MAG TPA: sodium:solute symporter family protein [Syntrophomonadaceae bacterium]|nr:sodium:solute symporter family protein [Syntrophomonadaceae bacterium]